MKFSILVSLLGLAPLIAIGAPPINPSRTVVYVESLKANELTRSVEERSGTGFVVKNGYIMTAAHVVFEREAGYATSTTVAFGSRQNHSYEVELVDVDHGLDIALLALPDYIDQVVEPVTIGDSGSVELLEDLVAYGYPVGLDLTAASGKLSKKVSERGRWQTNLDIHPGYSGGPVFNSRNEWVAIAIAGHEIRPSITYAIPEARTKRLLLIADAASPRTETTFDVKTMLVRYASFDGFGGFTKSSVQRTCLPENFRVARVEPTGNASTTSAQLVQSAPNCFDISASGTPGAVALARYEVLGVRTDDNWAEDERVIE